MLSPWQICAWRKDKDLALVLKEFRLWEVKVKIYFDSLGGRSEPRANFFLVVFVLVAVLLCLGFLRSKGKALLLFSLKIVSLFGLKTKSTSECQKYSLQISLEISSILPSLNF